MKTKSIVFTIKTSYSVESYFLPLKNGEEKTWEIKNAIDWMLEGKPKLREFLDGAKDDYIIEIYYGAVQGFSGTYEELNNGVTINL